MIPVTLHICSNYFSEQADAIDFISNPPINTPHQKQSEIKKPCLEIPGRVLVFVTLFCRIA
jgi:hypothetical protein